MGRAPNVEIGDHRHGRSERSHCAVHLGHALEYDSFPYAPRLDPLKSILAKLEPPTPLPEPLPPLKAARGRASDEGGGDADVQNFLIADW